MDFVSFWKASSIVLTGAFGALGLLRDYRDHDSGKLTKWGRISLGGIAISALFGLIAQVQDSNNEEKARIATLHYQDEQKLNGGLAAQNASLAAENSDNLAHPLTDLKIVAIFSIRCVDFLPEKLCNSFDGGPGYLETNQIKAPSIRFKIRVATESPPQEDTNWAADDAAVRSLPQREMAIWVSADPRSMLCRDGTPPDTTFPPGHYINCRVFVNSPNLHSTNFNSLKEFPGTTIEFDDSPGKDGAPQSLSWVKYLRAIIFRNSVGEEVRVWRPLLKVDEDKSGSPPFEYHGYYFFPMNSNPIAEASQMPPLYFSLNDLTSK